MTTQMHFRRLIAQALTILLLLAGTAVAQDLDIKPDEIADAALETAEQVPAREPKPAIEEMVITAQRKAQSLQEVPIAVTAFSAEALELQQISQFTDLQFNAPNVTFTQTNFGGGGNFAVRGIGSAAVATSGSPGVAFHINEAAIPTFIFQTEFYDLERVEILRGPQGTLYGASATGGVVNLITRKPRFEEFDANFEIDYGNFNSVKVKGGVSIPIGDRVAIRVAGLALQRDGMIKNYYNGSDVQNENIDGRDLWSLRATVTADITDTTHASFIFSRFKEDDNRARITKQLCNPTDTAQLGCTWDGDLETMQAGRPFPQAVAGATFAAYGGFLPWGPTPAELDPYSEQNNPGLQQKLDEDRRAVYTDMDPLYQAEESWYLLEVEQELPSDLTLSVIAAYHESQAVSMQDFNMDVGASFQPDAEGNTPVIPVSGTTNFDWSDENQAGVFAGNVMRSDTRIFGYDKSYGKGTTWYGEARVSSAWESAFNFLAGVNYTNGTGRTNYSVLANTLENVAVDATPILNPNGPIPVLPGLTGLYPSFFSNSTNPYVRNLFGIYGEGYWDITEQLKFTGGIRYNRDRKTIRDRSTLLNSLQYGGSVGTEPEKLCLIDVDPLQIGNQSDLNCALSFGAPFEYMPLGPVQPGVEGSVYCQGDPTGPDDPKNCLPGSALPPWNFSRLLKGSNTTETWSAFTGRAVLDYMTELPFTDETLLYLQWSRGYRPGGFNPAVNPTQFPGAEDTFDSEFVSAFEFGMKNKILDLGLVANFAAFYYDYTGYQISKLERGTAINENIDADVWGLELETMWAVPWVPGVLVDLNFSYLGTSIKNGESSVDPRDPAGERFNNDATFLAKDSIFGRACTLDRAAYTEAYESGRLEPGNAAQNYYVNEPTTFTEDGLPVLVNCNGMESAPDGNGGTVDLTVDQYRVEIEGNELPNAPTVSTKIGVQWLLPIEALGVNIIPRTDFYWQSSMWARIYNGPLDKISAWKRWDAQVIVEDDESRWYIRGYVKNILNSQNITGVTVLTAAVGNFTNIHVIEPRLFGFAVGMRL
ncbi:MAG: TonB-dependent receptor [Deltaproteobacteria bacterium]